MQCSNVRHAHAVHAVSPAVGPSGLCYNKSAEGAASASPDVAPFGGHGACIQSLATVVDESGASSHSKFREMLLKRSEAPERCKGSGFSRTRSPGEFVFDFFSIPAGRGLSQRTAACGTPRRDIRGAQLSATTADNSSSSESPVAGIRSGSCSKRRRDLLPMRSMERPERNRMGSGSDALITTEPTSRLMARPASGGRSLHRVFVQAVSDEPLAQASLLTPR